MRRTPKPAPERNRAPVNALCFIWWPSARLCRTATVVASGPQFSGLGPLARRWQAAGVMFEAMPVSVRGMRLTARKPPMPIHVPVNADPDALAVALARNAELVEREL